MAADYEDLPYNVAGTTVLKRDEGDDVRWFVLEEDLGGDGFRQLVVDEVEAEDEL